MDTLTATHDGTWFRTEREKRGFSRQIVATRSGLTVGRIAAIELGHGQLCTEVEEAKMLKALEIAWTEAFPGASAEDEIEVIIPHEELEAQYRAKAGEAEVQTTWCGLQLDDVVRVVGQPRATFKFKRYVLKLNGSEYVEVYGGKKGYFHIRCFDPDLVLTRKGKPVRRLWLSANPDEVQAVIEDEVPSTNEETEDEDGSDD